MEWLVLQHCLPLSSDHHQFAYRANRATEDATAFHTAFTNLEDQKHYVLFIDFSSPPNTVINWPPNLLTLDIPITPATGLKAFWQITTMPPPSPSLPPPPLHVALAPHRAVCWAPYLCFLHPRLCFNPSSLWMTWLWLFSSQKKMNQPTGLKSKDAQHGVQKTISS